MMTGLEIAAAGAALAQIVEYSCAVARFLRSLHRSAKSGPSWVQVYCSHLDQLIKTVGDLARFKSLDHCSKKYISRVLRSIETQASKLKKILDGSGTLKALWIQLARAKQVDELFRSLDQKRGLLSIHLQKHATLLLESIHQNTSPRFSLAAQVVEPPPTAVLMLDPRELPPNPNPTHYMCPLTTAPQGNPKKMADQPPKDIKELSERTESRAKATTSEPQVEASQKDKYGTVRGIPQASVFLRLGHSHNVNKVGDTKIEASKVNIGTNDVEGRTSTSNTVGSLETKESTFTCGTYSLQALRDFNKKDQATGK